MFALTPEARRLEAITAIIDLEGFTSFCSQPDSNIKLSRFLNFVFDRVDDSLRIAGLTDPPMHFKFLGDGALFIWSLENTDRHSVGRMVVLALHNLFRTYGDEIRDALDELGLSSFPRRIRVGIAQGEVIELRLQGTNSSEYVGFSINLAARLQHYFPELGFLISCSVSLPEEFIEEYSLIRARTAKIKGMSGVDVDVRYVKEDAEMLDAKLRKRWLLSPA